MILFLLGCLFCAVALPSVPLLCAWFFNLGRISVLVAGIVSLGILAMITHYVVFVFGVGEGDTYVPITIGKILAGFFMLCTIALVVKGRREKPNKNQDEK